MGWRENPEKRLRLRGKQSVKGECAKDVQPTPKEIACYNSDEDECKNKTIERIATDIHRSRKGAHARPTKFQSVLGQDGMVTSEPFLFVQRILTKGAKASGLMGRGGGTKARRLHRKDSIDERTQELQAVGLVD